MSVYTTILTVYAALTVPVWIVLGLAFKSAWKEVKAKRTQGATKDDVRD